jgi:hypothetical protein
MKIFKSYMFDRLCVFTLLTFAIARFFHLVLGKVRRLEGKRREEKRSSQIIKPNEDINWEEITDPLKIEVTSDHIIKPPTSQSIQPPPERQSPTHTHEEEKIVSPDQHSPSYP